MPAFLILALSWVLLIGKAFAYIIPLIILLNFLIYQLWELFGPINIIKINMRDKFFMLISRNLVKRFFAKNRKIYFNEIKEFAVTEAPEIMMEPRRFIISVVLKDSTNILFTSTSKQILAQQITKSLTQIIEGSKFDTQS